MGKPLDIVSWNVNSLRARAGYVAWYLDRAQPDVLCLQELKMPTEAVPGEIFTERGYEFVAHGQRQWNGVLVASRLPLECVQRGFPGEEGEARLLHVRTAGLDIVNVYCPQGQAADSPKFAYKLRYFRALRAWLAERVDPARPFVLLGDLNVAPHPEDLWNPEAMRGVPTFHPLELEEWAAIEALGLQDAVLPNLEPGGVRYTFWDYRGGAFPRNEGMRIDHILVTPPVLARVERAWVDRTARKKQQGMTPSDHAPLGIRLRDCDG